MLTNFYASTKTRKPFCGFACCGSKWGRIERSQYANVHGNNRIRKVRRYAKHSERPEINREILSEVQEYRNSISEYEAIMDE